MAVFPQQIQLEIHLQPSGHFEWKFGEMHALFAALAPNWPLATYFLLATEPLHARWPERSVVVQPFGPEHNSVTGVVAVEFNVKMKEKIEPKNQYADKFEETVQSCFWDIKFLLSAKVNNSSGSDRATDGYSHKGCDSISASDSFMAD